MMKNTYARRLLNKQVLMVYLSGYPTVEVQDVCDVPDVCEFHDVNYFNDVQNSHNFNLNSKKPELKNLTPTLLSLCIIEYMLH